MMGGRAPEVVPLADSVPALTELSETQRQQAWQRFTMLRPCLEGTVSQAEVARTSQLPLKTVQRWVYAYRRKGLAGLARQRRADRGQRRGMPPLYRQVIEGLALQVPKLSIAEIHRQACMIANRQGWPVLSYGRVYDIVQSLDPGLVTLAHEGSRVYQEIFDVLFLQEVSRPNERWQADHCLLNIWLLNEQGKPQRPYLTIILDEYSRAVMGYRLSFDAPSAYQTALTLRQAIWGKGDPAWPVCGIPDTFYTDHGSDFMSKHLEQVAANLSMQLIFSQPGRPRGRGKIERCFRTIKQIVLPPLPGYIPVVKRSYRSARKKQQAKRQRLLGMGRQAEQRATLTLPQFDVHLRTWLLQTYHHRWSRKLKSAPLSRWQEVKFLPRLPRSLQDLDLLLLRSEHTRIVHQEGIAFENGWYMDVSLAGYVNEQVVIRYDPADLTTLAVYVQDDPNTERFLCYASRQDPCEPAVRLPELVAARNGRRKELRAALQVRKAAVAQTQSPPLRETAPTPVRGRPKLKPPAFMRDIPAEFLPKES